MITWNTPIHSLSGVGPKTAAALTRLGIRTAGDLLTTAPFRYEDYSMVLPIARLQAGATATIQGKIELIGSRRSFRKRLYITEAAVRDDTGYVKLVWFNQPFLSRLLKPGDQIMASGRADWQAGVLQMVSPSYERATKETTHVGRIVPVYGVTEGLTPKHFRSLVKQVLPLSDSLVDPLPTSIRNAEKLPLLNDALRSLHFPKSQLDLQKAQTRRTFDELLHIQLEGLRTRALLGSHPAPIIRFHKEKTKSFVDGLGFRLTPGQRRSAWEIIRDLGKPRPMNRLLQGDVGSGKTVVVVIGLLNAGWSGLQSAVMAPTEILAEQHFKTIRSLIGQTLPIALLTGSQAVRSDRRVTTKRGLKQALARGEVAMVVGTHALIESDIGFRSLGLVIVDEQHRFGVRQRQSLRERSGEPNGLLPHFLSLTATPIPRTVALALYSDLDLSLIPDLPKNRKRVITKLVLPDQRSVMEEAVKQQLKAGHQAFVVTALIDESDVLGIKAATKTHEHLQTKVFPEFRVGLLHGRMKSNIKEAVMHKFASRQIDVLVSTAVIEVGIDVPNATVMVIEDADRFGLAQLHQFRGRVGRSDAQSYCFLLSEQAGAGSANSRLLAFSKLTDGFAVAEADFKRRGPGALRGDRQSGLADAGMTSLQNLELIRRARSVAEKLISQDPTLKQFPGLEKSTAGRGVHWE